MALPSAFNALETGVVHEDDPQSGLHDPFPGAKVGRMLTDRGSLRVKSLWLEVHATPGHAPGSTSWTWRSCESRRCVKIAFADSVTAVSADAYRFSAHRDYIDAFRASLKRIGQLGCDLLITPHPGASNLIPRLAGEAPLIAAGACAAYATGGRQGLDARLAKEAAGK
jgi:metallo-beta-lactamase class B